MRWADLDLLGHVNNVVYVDYLQEARVDMMTLHAPGSRAPEIGEGLVVVRHEVTYAPPLSLSADPVTVEAWVTSLRAASFTMAYELSGRDDSGEHQVFARATTLLSPYVFATGRPRRIRPDEREVLEQFVEPAVTEPRGRLGDVARCQPGEAGHYAAQVRFSDVDVYGHVNNVKYLEYLQESRIRLLDAVTGLGPSSRTTVVAQIDVDYKLPLVLRPEPYDLWSRIARVGRTSLTVESEICDGDTVLARARAVVVFFDPDTDRATEPDADLRARLVAASGV